MELIISRVKKERGLYLVTLSNGICHKFLPEIISSYNLNEGMSIDEGKLESVINENNNQVCFNELVKILSRRPHTTYEIKAKLFKKGFKSFQISSAVEKASGLKLLNDKDTAEIYISELSARGYGKYKIIQALKQKGVDADSILELTSDLCQDEKEEDRASEIFFKKLIFLKKNKSLTEQKIKERLFRFMQGKGFSNDIIFGLLRKISGKDEEF